MNNFSLYTILLDILKKEGKGMSITPDAVGYYLDWSSKQYFEQECVKYESTRRVGDSLLPFLRRTTIDGASLTLPSNYKHAIACDVIWDEYSEAPADIVTCLEYQDRRDNNLILPTVTNPVVCFMSEEDEYGAITHTIDVYPSTLDEIRLTYLKQPKACIFDYYINAEGDVVYLEGGESHTLGEDEEYSDGTATGTVVGTSQELEWNDHDRLKILEGVMLKLGVKMDNGAVMQYAGMLNQVNQAQP